jgi:carboxypeptidase Q
MRRALALLGALGLCRPAVAAEPAPAPRAVAAESAPALRAVAAQLIKALTTDKELYPRLAYLCDTFGPRLSGSANLEQALDWMLAQMRKDGLENAHGEPVQVPRWVRGAESATLLLPREQPLVMLGLGGSIGTPPEGITADAVVLHSFAELDERPERVKGKIVVFAPPFTSYEESSAYRVFGAVRAAAHGAVAVLTRSVTPYSLGAPHTGVTVYKLRDGTAALQKLPHAALSAEDAELLARLQERGERLRIRLRMGAMALAESPSRNLVAELRGSEHPEEVVVFGGHIDSWDVGQGAQDDGGNCVAAWHALLAMQRLGLRLRRTVRLVLWTNEENGSAGANAYAKAHATDRHVLALEADSGIFRPTGWTFSGPPAALVGVHELAALLTPLGATRIDTPGGGADLRPLQEQGVPVMGLSVAGERYFWYHHSAADTVDKVDPGDLGQVAAALAVMVYSAAQLL